MASGSGWASTHFSKRGGTHGGGGSARSRREAYANMEWASEIF